MSHVIAAKILGDVKSWSIKPYPHFIDGKFYFASFHVVYNKELEFPKYGAISLAPRIANFIAIELIILGFFLTGLPQMLLLIFCGGGVTDLFVGSLGIRETSDLQKAAKHLEINPWKLRILGIGFSLFGAVAIFAALI